VNVAIRTIGADRNEDRVAKWILQDCVILAVADGAGGISGSAQAAEMVTAVAQRAGTSDLDHLLRDVDVAISRDRSAGEATGVIVVVRQSIVTGASVGDSGAWLVTPTAVAWT
jgi:serine/threonine protein phosphatase PrpC